MSDIVYSLRSLPFPWAQDAADEIERLQAEIEYWKGFVPPQILRDFPFQGKEK